MAAEFYSNGTNLARMFSSGDIFLEGVKWLGLKNSGARTNHFV